jgi:Ca2+-transporting ATPase
MTARALIAGQHRFTTTGEGYSTDGQILHSGRMREIDLEPVVLPMALCADAVVKDGEFIANRFFFPHPTEQAEVSAGA